MKTVFKKIYALSIMLIVFISAVFITQYTYMNDKIIKNKEMNIEKSSETLGQKINSELKLYSGIIDYTSTMISSNNWSRDEMENNLNIMLKENSVFSLLYYGDGSGKLINATSWETPEDYELRARPWYTKALEEKTLIYSETFVDALTGQLAIAIAKPVYGPNNEIQGVVGGDILISEIIKIVEHSRSKVSDFGYSLLVDGRGNILAHPDYIYDDYTNLKNIDELSETLSEEIKKNKLGKTQITIDGIAGYLSYQPVENTDWVIGSFASLKEYEASNRYLFKILGTALLVALVILLVFLYLQNHYIVKPLKRLVNDIEDITIKDNIYDRLLVNGKDPFNEPRKSINHILGKTEASFRLKQEYSEELMASYEELEAQNNQLYHLTNYDQLTQLYNRRSYHKKINDIDLEENLPLGIIMADVNGLKLINDSFGNLVGDELLKETGRILFEACGPDQSVFRVGGDEFIITLPQTNEKEVEKLMKEIKALSKQVSLKNIDLSISFGMAIKYEKNEDISDILKEAEDHMYSNKLLEGPSMRSKTIETIIQTLYEKNPREKDHSTRVSVICQEMGIELGLSDIKIKQLETVGLLHDIGKIAISNEILEKEGSLSEKEWEEIKRHPEIGYRILSTTKEMTEIAEYALSHHERYDGKGYPQGLKGKEIPLMSRIITIADAYDAMVSDRPYRKGLSKDIAVEEMKKNAGSQFDPYLTEMFLEKII